MRSSAPSPIATNKGGKEADWYVWQSPIGVLLSEEEVTHIYHLLINLRADDLITEEQRYAALETMQRIFLDIRCLRQDNHQSSVSQRSVASQ